MNTIIPIVIVSMMVIGLAVALVGAIFAKTKDEIAFERDKQVTREIQEYLDNKYKKDLAKCRTQKDYEKLRLSVENGDYIAPQLFS